MYFTYSRYRCRFSLINETIRAGSVLISVGIVTYLAGVTVSIVLRVSSVNMSIVLSMFILVVRVRVFGTLASIVFCRFASL